MTISPPALPFVLLHTTVILRARCFVNLPIRFSPLAAGVHEGIINVAIEEREGQEEVAVEEKDEDKEMKNGGCGVGAGVEVAALRLLATSVQHHHQ